MTTNAWISTYGQDCEPFAQVVAESLACVGVDSYPLNGQSPSGPGVLCLSAITTQLCDLLQRLSRNGVERVFAIAVPGAELGVAAWQLLQAGASDVLIWDDLVDPAHVIAARIERWRTIDDLVSSPLVRNNLVGNSPRWIALLRQIVEVAHFTDAAVLITGETGTGKELMARLIHSLDGRRAKQDLIVSDCTTIVPELSGSEFFGHERGAFTNAVAARDGAFALADGGTLFLDEVGELPLGLQAQLLRVVQERMYKRVGSNTWRHTNFRLVCATNRDLMEEAAGGRFRRDLYYRLATWFCHIPSLAERVEDIIPLACHFMQEFQPHTPVPPLSEPLRRYLVTRSYPGNVRDLRQLVHRIMCRHTGPGPITIGDIPSEERPAGPLHEEEWHGVSFEQEIRRALQLGVGLKTLRRAVDETAVRIAIDDEQGNLQRAARKLGVTDRALQVREASRRQNGHVPAGER